MDIRRATRRFHYLDPDAVQYAVIEKGDIVGKELTTPIFDPTPTHSWAKGYRVCDLRRALKYWHPGKSLYHVFTVTSPIPLEEGVNRVESIQVIGKISESDLRAMCRRYHADRPSFNLEGAFFPVNFLQQRGVKTFDEGEAIELANKWFKLFGYGIPIDQVVRKTLSGQADKDYSDAASISVPCFQWYLSIVMRLFRPHLDIQAYWNDMAAGYAYSLLPNIPPNRFNRQLIESCFALLVLLKKGLIPIRIESEYYILVGSTRILRKIG